ncbi:pleckstrin homology-like domain family B member 1 isoform X2 [Stegodyphus dumicola]|uniref:pleckstrin homology-like domain family B member 1 isoform X2 n=1 Tax=Stegodyphus dumicola TaxID=202533 RepID=UPI0015AC4B7E|nr:pleckstrin homology-like domain family B member 1 isoform X2 [Stegodyphus dumicola]
MTSLGVWKVPSAYPSGFKNPLLGNGSFLEVNSAPKDGLAISESGHTFKVQTEGPHLVSLGSGRLNTAITIHPLPEGRVYVGSIVAQHQKDIIIHGPGIEKDHCFIDNNNGLVTIYPQHGDVSIDGVLIVEPTCLSQGCILCLGRSNFFRFNNPKEAHLMKQASPAPRKIVSGFVPESTSNQQPYFDGSRSLVDQYMDGIDLVEKVSKYEYMSHSQPPTITSQDIPKYFVKEGIRILHSAPPVLRMHKGYSSETSIKNPSPASRRFSPLGAKPGFSTPPPYLHRTNHSRVTMSPKTTRLYSKTPDPIVMGRKSPATVWSGRCTPTSPMLSGRRSHHVSVENLKACELELHEQHRKAVQERLKDQEQEKQERLRLEEILHLCAEYEEQAQKERLSKNKLIAESKDPASSSSSGEFSSVSNDSSLPASTNSSDTSQVISSKSDSVVEGYSSEDSKCNGVLKYSTLPLASQNLQNPISSPSVNSISIKSNSSSFISPSGYHTVPNRIKTNGSLPRDRGNLQLSPTNEPQNFGSLSGSDNIISNNGATTFVNHKALNSASSEDELCAILGNSSVSKQSPSNECSPSSPCMGTAFLTYPHSPRTRIKTVINHRERGPEVYENKMALSDLGARKNLSLNLPVSDRLPNPSESKLELFDGAKYINANYQSLNHISIDLGDEINKLQKEKQECLQAITSIKIKVSELDCQKNEILNELQLEHALIANEYKEKEQLQIFEGNKLAEIQKQKLSLEQKSEVTQQELEAAKAKVQQQEKLVEDLQNELHSIQPNSINEAEITSKLHELQAQSELLDIERKAFEDLEFQQLESQAHEEEEKEELSQEIECFKETIAQRQIELNEISKQKQSLVAQMEKEKLKCESQLQVFTEQLRQEISNLERIHDKLKALTSVKPGGTPCSSPESSPRTSDSDVEGQRNGVWNTHPHVTLDDNVVPRRHQSEERSDNCNSFHSFESESSSLTSSDTGGEGGRRSEDKLKATEGRTLDTNKVLQKERAIQSAFQDQTPLVNHHHENGNFEIRRREKPRAQRPLTRYLPVRNAEFDLRQHIESAGHQIELCVHIHLTATSCHGYLHKLGGAWKTWKKRWFVFDRIQKALLYYSDKGETKLKGGVNFQAIEDVYVDHQHSVKSPCPQSTFCVKTYDRIYYLMAPTPEAMRIWVDVIFSGAEGYRDFLGEAE